MSGSTSPACLEVNDTARRCCRSAGDARSNCRGKVRAGLDSGVASPSTHWRRRSGRFGEDQDPATISRWGSGSEEMREERLVAPTGASSNISTHSDLATFARLEKFLRRLDSFRRLEVAA